MGEMRDSDWSREILLRSDWLSPFVAICTTRAKFIVRIQLILKAWRYVMIATANNIKCKDLAKHRDS